VAEGFLGLARLKSLSSQPRHGACIVHCWVELLFAAANTASFLTGQGGGHCLGGVAVTEVIASKPCSTCLAGSLGLAVPPSWDSQAKGWSMGSFSAQLRWIWVMISGLKDGSKRHVHGPAPPPRACK
jgi:hypothetical protein